MRQIAKKGSICDFAEIPENVRRYSSLPMIYRLNGM